MHGPSVSVGRAGRFDASWDALGLYIWSFSLYGLSLPQQLPGSWVRSLTGLGYLTMDDCGLEGTLPPEWGQAEAFPQLQQIWLANNPKLMGGSLACLYSSTGVIIPCLSHTRANAGWRHTP